MRGMGALTPTGGLLVCSYAAVVFQITFFHNKHDKQKVEKMKL